MAKAISADDLGSAALRAAEPKSSASTAVLSSVFGIDLRTLAFFRIGMALLVLADLIVRAPDITAFYTERGTMPLEVARRAADRTDWAFLSPFMWVESAFAVGVLFWILAAAAVGMLIGWRTRLMTFLVWFLLCGLHMRNPMILHSGDTLTRLMLFWALFLPMGARWSIDSLAARQAAAGIVPPKRILSFASAALLLQISFVYWFTALLKTGPEWRTEFSALYYALSIEQYQTALGRWILSLRWPLAPLTVTTMTWEIVGPILAFLPFATERIRLWVVAGFWFFHLIGIGMLMDIGSFPWICAVAWSAFLPGLAWDRLAAWWARIQPQNAVKKDMEAARAKLLAWRDRRLAADLERGMVVPRLRPSLVNQAVAVLFLTIVFVWNVRTTDLRGYVPKWVPYIPASVQWLTRIDQSWAMFSPMPLKQDGWWVVPARTMSGKDIDLFQGGVPLVWRKPADIAATYPNSRWCKYMMNLWSPENEWYRVYLCRYLTQQYNEHHRDGINAAQLYFMEQTIRPNYAARQIVPHQLYDFDGTMPEEKIITKAVTVEAKAER